MDSKEQKIYIKHLEEKLNKIKSVINFTEKMVQDQSNNMTDGEICVSAMKDIKRHVKGK